MTADLIEVLNFDDKSDSKREVVDQSLLSDIRAKIRKARDELRANHLPRLVTWCKSCERCDMAGLCRKRGG